MLAKLIVIVVTIGATACGVLVIRQQRIDVAHDMARVHRRIHEKEMQLWDLRVQIHNRLNSDTIRLMIERYEQHHGEPLVPLRFDPGLEIVSLPQVPLGPRQPEGTVAPAGSTSAPADDGPEGGAPPEQEDDGARETLARTVSSDE